ncbi:hypothetical protein [Streptomyces sp. KR55]|uniref:hypothetical protein n=1 Tax=Streptomyces sp. KR55 TaxID=3457425 RepID=UPI003FD4B197
MQATVEKAGQPADRIRPRGLRARLRAPEERHILTNLRLDVRHATTLLRALLVLTNLEVTR